MKKTTFLTKHRCLLQEFLHLVHYFLFDGVYVRFSQTLLESGFTQKTLAALLGKKKTKSDYCCRQLYCHISETQNSCTALAVHNTGGSSSCSFFFSPPLHEDTYSTCFRKMSALQKRHRGSRGLRKVTRICF